METSSFWCVDTSRHYVVGMLCLIRRLTCRYAHKLFAWLSTKFHHLYYTFPPECLASFVNSRIAKHYYVLSHNTKILHLAWKVLYSFTLLKHAVVCVLCVSYTSTAATITTTAIATQTQLCLSIFVNPDLPINLVGDKSDEHNLFLADNEKSNLLWIFKSVVMNQQGLCFTRWASKMNLEPIYTSSSVILSFYINDGFRFWNNNTRTDVLTYIHTPHTRKRLKLTLQLFILEYTQSMFYYFHNTELVFNGCFVIITAIF